MSQYRGNVRKLWKGKLPNEPEVFWVVETNEGKLSFNSIENYAPYDSVENALNHRWNGVFVMGYLNDASSVAKRWRKRLAHSTLIYELGFLPLQTEFIQKQTVQQKQAIPAPECHCPNYWDHKTDCQYVIWNNQQRVLARQRVIT